MNHQLQNIYNFFRYDIFYGIRNLIKWFPIIWGDRDWDSYYIFKLLYKKLSHVENFTREYGNHVSSDRDADKIKICVLLLDRLIKRDYGEMVFRNHDKKWGELEIKYSESDKCGYKTLDVCRAKATTPKEKEQERRESIRLYKHEDMLEERDKTYLFELMNKYILGWWD